MSAQDINERLRQAQENLMSRKNSIASASESGSTASAYGFLHGQIGPKEDPLKLLFDSAARGGGGFGQFVKSTNVFAAFDTIKNLQGLAIASQSVTPGGLGSLFLDTKINALTTQTATSIAQGGRGK